MNTKSEGADARQGIARILAALSKRKINAFVIPTNLEDWRRTTPSDEERTALDAAEVIFYARSSGELCVFVGSFNGEVFEQEQLDELASKIEASNDRDAALWVLRGAK